MFNGVISVESNDWTMRNVIIYLFYRYIDASFKRTQFILKPQSPIHQHGSLDKISPKACHRPFMLDVGITSLYLVFSLDRWQINLKHIKYFTFNSVIQRDIYFTETTPLHTYTWANVQ